ncbi:MAG: KaiA domain-containing protein [Rivularia sp. (in: cyanobacteria)]
MSQSEIMLLYEQMNPNQKKEILKQIKSEYRQILIKYFTNDKSIKEQIDKLINSIFCANVPVPQIIEIHMELVDEFSKQLKIEGRSDYSSLLLDYRLTLIDMLAHLCELYRRHASKA